MSTRRTKAVGRFRRGFSLIELLVALGLIVLLASLLFAGIAATRSSMLRATCLGRMHQLGLALHHYEDLHGGLPLAGAYMAGLSASPLARMMPQLDQSVISERLNWSILNAHSPFTVPENRTAATATIAAFLCPADGRRKGGTNYFYCEGVGMYWGTLDGKTVLVYDDSDSLFPRARFRRAADVTKGLSHVAAFSERLQGDGADAWLDRRRDVLTSLNLGYQIGLLEPREPFSRACEALDSAAGNWGLHFSEAGHSWLLPNLALTAYNHSATPNVPTADCGYANPGPPGQVGMFTARSNHRGGVNLLFADGHVEFIADSIDRQIWIRYGHIHDRLARE